MYCQHADYITKLNIYLCGEIISQEDREIRLKENLKMTELKLLSPLFSNTG